MTKFKYIITSLSLGLLSPALSAQQEIIYGNGDFTNPVRDVEPFERVVLSGPIDLTINNDYSRHNCKSMRMSIDKNLLQYVRVASQDKTLSISLPPFAIPSNWARATSDCKNLQYVRTESNARIGLNLGENAETIRAENNNGVISIGGKANILSASAVNNGVITTELLHAKESHIEAGANSFIEINNSDRINTSIDGNGTILIFDKNQNQHRMRELSKGVNVLAPNYYHHGFATAYFDKIEYAKLKPRLIEAAKNLPKEQ